MTSKKADDFSNDSTAHRLKVLHIIWSAKSGGIERLVYSLLNELQKDDTIKVDILIGQAKGVSMKEMIGNPTIHLGYFNSGSDMRWGHISKTKKFFEHYDILHFHTFHLGTAIAAILSKKRVCFTEHGNFGFGKKKGKVFFIVEFFKKIFLNHFSDVITFNSDFSRSISEKRYGLQKVDHTVVYNGVAETEPSVVALPERDIEKLIKDKFVIAFVGRLAGVKRIDRLIRAISFIQERSDIVLLIMGVGPLEAELKALTKVLDVEHNVYFAGYRSRIHTYISICDIFILPSQNEAFGLVVVEAYSEGKPVLVFNDGGGAAELVNAIEPGMIVKNEEELAKKIIEIKINPEARNKLNVEKRILYSKKFRIKTMADKFKEIYSSI